MEQMLSALLRELETMTSYIARNIEDIDFETLVSFVDKRETLIEQMKQLHLTDAQRRESRTAIMALLALDPPILARLNRLRDEAAVQMNKLQTGKKQAHAYDASFGEESRYFDKRK